MTPAPHEPLAPDIRDAIDYLSSNLADPVAEPVRYQSAARRLAKWAGEVGGTSWDALARDSAEDHTHLVGLCLAAGIPREKVEGDGHGVPGIGDLGDMLAAENERLAAELAALWETTGPVVAMFIDERTDAIKGKMGGQLCVKGHRFPIAQLLAELVDNSLSDIADNYDIEIAELKASLESVAWHLGEIPAAKIVAALDAPELRMGREEANNAT